MAPAARHPKTNPLFSQDSHLSCRPHTFAETHLNDSYNDAEFKSIAAYTYFINKDFVTACELIDFYYQQGGKNTAYIKLYVDFLINLKDKTNIKSK